MRLSSKRARRSGATMVEYAIVLTILVFLMLGTIVAAIGVFYYQQVSLLAREGSRYASVHGAEYAREEGVAAATATDIYNNAIVPKMAGLDKNLLTYSVSWNTNNEQFHGIILANGNLGKVRNTVSVTVNYQWNPQGLFPSQRLSSTSVTFMNF